MHENVPNLDIISLLCVASMAVENQLIVSMAQEKCALNLNSLLFHMSQDAISLTNDFNINYDMITLASLFDSLKCFNLRCRNCLLWPVIQDAAPFWAVHISLVSMKQTIGNDCH